MNDYLSNLQEAIKVLHGSEAVHVDTYEVAIGRGDQVAFSGEVAQFHIIGTNNDCYAWGYMEGGEFKTSVVLRSSEIDTPFKAVLAAIGKEIQERS